jgi:hypothetical protein
MTSSSLLVLRALRVVCILLFPLAMDILITSVAALFYSDSIPILHSLVLTSISIVTLFGVLVCVRYVAQKTALSDSRPPAAYDRGVYFILLGGAACWASIFFPSIGWICGWVLLLTIVSGLYVLIKVKAFYWRYYIIIGLAFGLATAPFSLVGMIAASRHSHAEPTATTQK